MTAHGGFTGYVTQSGSFPGSDQTRLSAEIYRMFLGCEKQQLSFNTIADRVLNADLFWSTQIGVNEYEAKLPVDDYTYSVWVLFIRRLLEQIVLYGFAIYRLVPLPPFTPVDLMSDHKNKKAKVTTHSPPRRRTRHPEVADGQEIGLEWDAHFHVWKFTHTSGGEVTAKDGWHLLMFAEPRVVRPGNSVIYASMSANAYELSEKLHTLTDRIMERDRINSSISVLTQFSKYFGTNGTSTKPFIQPAVQSSMLSVPDNVFTDVDEAIRNRAEVAMKIAKATDSMRKETYRAYEQTSALESRDFRRKKPVPKPMRHDEYMITDAQDGTQIDFLKAPEALESLLERFENGILFAFLIPPQALGKNINSERIAASNRLAESAIERYEDMIKTLRRLVQIALTRTSREISGDPSGQTSIHIRPCISAHALGMLEPLLKPHVALDLHACLHDVPKNYLDLASIKKQQKLLLEPNGPPNQVGGAKPKAPSTPGAAGPAGSKSEAARDKKSTERNRPTQTNAQKSTNMRAKATS
jgi:hypothetical protein